VTAVEGAVPEPTDGREALAEVLAAHCPVYDYREGHFTMECEACDFILGGVDREDCKRRFGEHHAAALAPTVARLVAEAEERAGERIAETIGAHIRTLGRTNPGDPVRAGLIEGYRGAARIARGETP
jgi:hypothetical protein